LSRVAGYVGQAVSSAHRKYDWGVRHLGAGDARGRPLAAIWKFGGRRERGRRLLINLCLQSSLSVSGWIIARALRPRCTPVAIKFVQMRCSVEPLCDMLPHEVADMRVVVANRASPTEVRSLRMRVLFRLFRGVLDARRLGGKGHR